ncbi:glycosyl transferase family 2 [Planctopirus limnophila DSM 3776]|uniref:Glycosyl transferase family 2 n=1 Tax=Planctopirus limnophila (strain ATCC 43296 / DSM 3776 / IFAM 1008 / Mu 290) TaxID=521674 RepID=D5STB4_PLAL2|nr:glycosyltransferase family 25 protein [Planctopirus limnophila]ADG66882.1 glycosyl transferase family 2 [Planctopirus limnophila DSM 3776]
MEYARAFVIVSDDRYFPGLQAALGSIHAYYGQEIRVFVVGHGLTAPQVESLKNHPLGSAITLLRTQDFASRPSGCWEAKQLCLSELVASVRTVCLMDADLILLSRVDDIFELAEQGKIISSRDGEGMQFGPEYQVYSPALVGPRQDYINSGFLIFDLRQHWDLVALWSFTARFAGYSPGKGWPFAFPGHGDQGVFNALLALQQKSDFLHALPENTWCNSAGWKEGRKVRVTHQEGNRLSVIHEPGGEQQRVLHSSGPKWWTDEGRTFFASAGDVLRCFDAMRKITEPTMGSNKNLGISSPEERSKPALSVCVAIKNRSKVSVGLESRELFPNCIRSLLSASAGGLKIELVVVDFQSDDWPLEEWFSNLVGDVAHQLITLREPFSRGRGLNVAASAARSDRLLFLDADMLVDNSVLERAYEVVNSGRVWLPICECVKSDGTFDSWGFLGNVACDREVWNAAGQIPEFYSWGGEDNLFADRLQSIKPGIREVSLGFRHQWHPESLRHAYYIRPAQSDFFRIDQQATSPVQQLWRLSAHHPEWQGEIQFFTTGRMGRPGGMFGSFQASAEQLTLHWDSGHSDTFRWDSTVQRYVHDLLDFWLEPFTSLESMDIERLLNRQVEALSLEETPKSFKHLTIPLPDLLSRRDLLPRILVFSSVGDRGIAVNSWLGISSARQDRPFDTAIVYYGNYPTGDWAQGLRARSCYFGRHRGGKIQNLSWLIKQHPTLLEDYDYVFVLDDDLRITPDMIGRVVRTAREFDLPICSPSHDWRGRISWLHMGARGSGRRAAEPPAGVELTNFVEVTCPLFETDALREYLNHFLWCGSELTGWGDDWLMTAACFQESRPFGVLHNITICNPKDRPGPNPQLREIDQLHAVEERLTAWKRVKQRLGGRLPVTEEVRTWLPRPRLRCVNLPRATERRKKITCEWIDGLGFPIKFFPAFDRRELEKGRSFFQYEDSAAINKIGRPLTAGEIACASSHALVIREEMEFTGPEGVIILEDDVTPRWGAVDLFERLKTAAAALPGVEAIACHEALDSWERGESCGEAVRALSPPWGTHITWYSHAGLCRAYESLIKFDQPADWIWREFCSRGAYALLDPPIAQHRGDSTYVGNDFRGMVRPYRE